MRRIFLFAILVIFVPFSRALDCKKDCENPDFSNPNYKPQDCAKYCKNKIYMKHSDTSVEDEVEELQDRVQRLTSMMVALLVLVTLIFSALIFLIIRKLNMKQILSSFRRKTEKTAPPTEISVMNGNVQSHGLNIHNHTNNIPVKDTYMNNSSELKPRSSSKETRRKSPSESTCPDEGDALEVNGYDNLAMSRSTLATHSAPSSPVSPSTTDVFETSICNTTTTAVHMDSVSSPGQENEF